MKGGRKCGGLLEGTQLCTVDSTERRRRKAFIDSGTRLWNIQNLFAIVVQGDCTREVVLKVIFDIYTRGDPFLLNCQIG